MATTTSTLPARPSRAAGTGSDFAELRRRVDATGLLERRPRYYTVRIGAVAAALVAGWSAFFVVGASWWTLLVAAFLAVVFAQVALVAHDLAHRQVFRSNRTSARAGLVAGNLVIGMSYGYWMAKHTAHHANPNHDDLDPDVGPGLLAWDAERARGFVARHQAYLFFPLLTLLGISLKRDSVRALRDGTVKRPRLEGGLLAVHAVLYVGAVLAVLAPCRRWPSWWCTRRCSGSTSG
ncbi:fatty acid desaturase family protein [Nocardioides anomalus]|uniref:fatty acid desaturase family protein n=1 Tax=Nocardioides anomalus TaxID=2712223 RepID=UPI002E79F3DB|nr:fatty acid desaturase [Nocardioides anomalus]